VSMEEYIGLFFYGIATFLSPCSVALTLAYLMYSVGTSRGVRRGFIIGVCFLIAMSSVFFALGYALTALIPAEIISSKFFYIISGVILIFFGYRNMGLTKGLNFIFKIENSLAEKSDALKYTVFTRVSEYNYVIGSFMFGVTISVALGPCSLALVLPAMMFTLFSAPTPYHGGLLLLSFGAGHAAPVVVLSTLLAMARDIASDKLAGLGHRFTKLFGLAFVVMGVILIVNQFM